MKLLTGLAITAALLLSVPCQGQTGRDIEEAPVLQTSDIEVYYFHFTRRCATCEAVEKVSHEAVSELYGDRIPFRGYNLDDAEGKEKADELGVKGQTLMIVSGDKKINITNEGFMLARSNPEKLKQVISDQITPML